MPQHTPLEQLKLLKALQGQANTDATALADLAASPIDSSFRNPGQTGRDAFFNPDQDQAKVRQNIGLALLGADPSKGVGANFAEAIAGGNTLMESIKQGNRDNELKGAGVTAKASAADFGRGVELLKLEDSLTPKAKACISRVYPQSE